MELFYSENINGGFLRLGEEESRHCIKVLRHRDGDEISVIDGKGSLFRCRIVSCSARETEAEILDVTERWGAHSYRLEMAVCPTKNIDRYEWFVEKACEIGVDSIVPVIGEHSERKDLRTDRLRKILLSATKQSLKAEIPRVGDTMAVREYIRSLADQEDRLKLIACCFEDGSRPRISITEALRERPCGRHGISVLIGPEGDFSREEAALAIGSGFIPVHLGPSRLRTETAALAAVFAVYSMSGLK